MESSVAAISNTYTNAIQLKARLGVLQQRSQLKYAALDCWQLVAQDLPSALTLLRSSFVDGHKLALNGQVDAADTLKLSDFYDALRKAKHNDQAMFDTSPGMGDPLAYRQQGDKVVWNFGLELLHVEAEAK